MEITKHGNKREEEKKNYEEFECSHCGCKFKAEEDEYYIQEASPWALNGTISTTSVCSVSCMHDKYICSCPECHKIIVKDKSRYISNPLVTLTSECVNGTQVEPDPCASCSNNPANGGSGICHCILGTPSVT